VVPVLTVHAGPNPKYFGMGYGVTYYNLNSDQFTGLSGIVVPGRLGDRLVLLAVVLEQRTELNPTEIMTDNRRIHRCRVRIVPAARIPPQPKNRRYG
jgi:TnpA family transposase